MSNDTIDAGVVNENPSEVMTEEQLQASLDAALQTEETAAPETAAETTPEPEKKARKTRKKKGEYDGPEGKWSVVVDHETKVGTIKDQTEVWNYELHGKLKEPQFVDLENAKMYEAYIYFPQRIAYNQREFDKTMKPLRAAMAALIMELEESKKIAATLQIEEPEQRQQLATVLATVGEGEELGISLEQQMEAIQMLMAARAAAKE